MQVEVAQLTGPRDSQGAGTESIAVDKSQPADTTEQIVIAEVISDEAATVIRTTAAIAFRNRAVEHMAVNNKVELKALVEELADWQPCAASLRKSGLSLIFDDITVWEGASLSEQVFALRTKFSRTMKQGRRKSSSESVIPFSEASMRQFKQNVDSMEAFVQEKDVAGADPGIFRRLAYHLVMNSFTVPQSLEGLKVDSCHSFIKSVHEAAILNRAIANGTAIAEDDRSRMIKARNAEFRAACNSEKMVNALRVSMHWNKKYLQAASLQLQRDFVNLGINLEKMPPRAVAAQMARARACGLDVLKPALDRAKLTQLSRNAGSLDSLRSGVRVWHFFATSVLDYKENISAPPRSSEHVLLWLTCFGQYATALNYLQYLRNFCEIEGLSIAWYDNSIISLKT